MDLHAGMAFLHLGFAAVWTGSVLFLSWGVLPAVERDSIDRKSIESIRRRFLAVSRVSALVLLVSGGLMASQYGGHLTSTTPGHLVLGMTGLWLLLIGAVEVAGKGLRDGLETADPATAVAQSSRRFHVAGVLALLLLVDAGLLSVF
jgi:putative copper export protein